MKNETLQRLLKLVNMTGDRVIISDPAGDNPYVLMSLGQYEQLLGVEDKPKKTSKPVNKPVIQVAEDLDPPVQSKSLKREIPLWKSDTHLTGPQARPESQAKPSSKTEPKPSFKIEVAAELESEETFYLEPLE